MNRLKRVATLALIMLPLAAFGQAKVGTTGLNFLKIGLCARPVGIAAFTAVADDGSALYYNPAGLLQLKTPEALFSYIDYPADLQFGHVGGVWPLPRMNGVFGVQVTSMYSGDIMETTPERPYGTGRTFYASDICAGVSWGQQLTDKFSVGVTLKYLNEQLADRSATGWGADVGTFYNTGWKRICIGMVIQNFGPDMEFETSPFPLPMNFKFGASVVAMEKGPHRLLLSGEFVHPNDNLEEYIAGGEYEYLGMLALRIGKKSNAWKRYTWSEYQENRDRDAFVEYPVISEKGGICLDGASLGLGLKLPEYGIGVDYAWAGLGTLGPVHRFTLSVKLRGLFGK